MKTYPVKPEKFKYRTKQMLFILKAMGPIPCITIFECKHVLNAYYGSDWATARAILKEAAAAWLTGKHISLVMWITDRMGWTKLYHFPETAEFLEHWKRHGRQCHGSPNCSDSECIDRGIPIWFRKATRLTRYVSP